VHIFPTTAFFRKHLFWAVLVALELSATAEDWPQFRGPTGQGISSATNVPITWDARKNISWRVPLSGQGWSSPVAKDGAIIVTAAETSPAISLHVLCLSADSGSVKWKTEVFRPAESETKALHKKNSLASPTAIIDGKRVYAHFGHLGTAALDFDTGKVLWRQNELKYPPVHGNGGSPILLESKLIFSCDGAKDPFIACLDANDGRVLWRTSRNSQSPRTFSFSTPLAINVDGKTEVISPASGFAAAYDPRNGKELWRCRYGEGYSVVPRPVLANGVMFLSSGFDRPLIYAIDPKGAAGDITDTKVLWKATKGAPNTPSLIASASELYAVSDAGIATCYDQKTAKIHWNERLGGNFSASPVLAENRIYAINEEGVTYVLKAGTKYELLSKNELGERCLSSPGVLNGAILIRTEGHLWRIGSK
jgi:outer membrane protein assembly factor BamB